MITPHSPTRVRVRAAARTRRRGAGTPDVAAATPSDAVPYAAVVGRVADVLRAGPPAGDAAAARVLAERLVDDVLGFAVRWLDP